MKTPNLVFLSLIILLISCGKKNHAVDPVKPIDDNYHKNGEVSKLYFHDAGAVNIVVLGDGFIKADLKKGGAFDVQAKLLIDYLFTVAPFAQNKDHFNTYVVYVESKNRGATKGIDVTGGHTKFNSFFDKQTDRLLEVGNYDSCYTYAQKALPYDKTHLIVMIVNDNTYGGSGGGIAVVSTNTLSKYIFVHETGHTFAGLGDEYADFSIAANYPVDVVPYIPNVDNTDDPAKIKWAHFFDKPAYNGIVGAYEGAYYRLTGFYRPEYRSIMSDLGILSFNAPSREAIARRIATISNIPFDFDAFLKADASSTMPIFATTKGGIPPLLPKNDFINMRQRIQQLQKEKQQ